MLLDRLKTVLQEKRPRLAHTKVLFHHDNLSAHALAVVAAKPLELELQIIPYPLLFQNLVGEFSLKRGDDFAETNGYFTDLSESHYSEEISKLEQRWKQCKGLKENVVEKQVYPNKLSNFHFCTSPIAADTAPIAGKINA